jgi:hypothetical protein
MFPGERDRSFGVNVTSDSRAEGVRFFVEGRMPAKRKAMSKIKKFSA